MLLSIAIGVPLLQNYLGDIYALLTAVSWSVAVIFFKLSGDHLDTMALKVFQNVVSVILFFATILIIHDPLFLTMSIDSWVRVIISAVIGITLGDTFYLAAINRIGAGPQALVDGLYMPFVGVLAYFYFGEKLPPQVIVGSIIVLIAVLIAHLDLLKSRLPKKNLWSGLTFAVLSQLSMAICVVMVKDLLVTQPLLTLTAYRFLIGTAVLVIYNLVIGNGRKILVGFRPRRNWLITMSGTILGPYLATLLWFAGFKYTLAGKAAAYNQLSTIFIVLLAALFLGERLTKNRLIAVIMATIGSLVIFQS